MICLDMGSILTLRIMLGYSVRGWHEYTRLPVQTIVDMETLDDRDFEFIGDSKNYDYLRMYQTLMIKQAIKHIDVYGSEENSETYKKIQKVITESELKLLRSEDDSRLIFF